MSPDGSAVAGDGGRGGRGDGGGGNGDAGGGTRDMSAGADGGATDGPNVSCAVFDQSCKGSADCCSGICDPVKLVCTMPPSCTAAGGACMLSTDCCGLSCIGGKCQKACTSDGQACTDPAQCCSGICTGGMCAPLNPGAGCKSAGNSCAMDTDCCSGLCNASRVCATASSFCHQVNDVCAANSECCTQNCVIAAGHTLGTCQANPTSGSGGCAIAGTLCNGCGTCCSALCLPYNSGPTSICEEAQGCHVTGDLCTKTSDCCGAPGTGLPGAGNVYCNIAPGAKVGTCHNPSGCNPEGAICHYKGPIMACGNSRNDCCAAPGNSGVCKLDTEGIPRCYGLGKKCVMAGGACADSGDCCDELACVPDASGQLHCGYMGMACSPAGGPCTVAADCCDAGDVCIISPGSVQGVCTAPMSSGGGMDGGTGGGMDGGTGGAADGGTADGGGGSDMGVCALYGQGCSVDGTQCCDGVPCSAPGGLGLPCAPGETGCTCYMIIP